MTIWKMIKSVNVFPDGDKIQLSWFLNFNKFVEKLHCNEQIVYVRKQHIYVYFCYRGIMNNLNNKWWYKGIQFFSNANNIYNKLYSKNGTICTYCLQNLTANMYYYGNQTTLLLGDENLDAIMTLHPCESSNYPAN